jgi:hypothetical protein
LLEARRFGAPIAIMLVQSFRDDATSWNDFVAFCNLMGAEAVHNGFAEANPISDRRLFLGWVTCPLATDAQFAAVI